jgi:hypothetical protein
MVFGASYRPDEKFCLRIERSNNAEILNTLFLQNILPLSTVITDMSALKKLTNLGKPFIRQLFSAFC